MRRFILATLLIAGGCGYANQDQSTLQSHRLAEVAINSPTQVNSQQEKNHSHPPAQDHIQLAHQINKAAKEHYHDISAAPPMISISAIDFTNLGMLSYSWGSRSCNLIAWG